MSPQGETAPRRGLLKQRWWLGPVGVLALWLAERAMVYGLSAADGAQVLMAMGPDTPVWLILAFALMMTLRLSLWLVAPGWLIGWMMAALWAALRGTRDATPTGV